MADASAWAGSDDQVRTLLRESKTIALVGASPRPWRDSNGIMQVLLAAGFSVVPVNPNYDEVLGRACVPDLRSVPEPIDIVDIFRRPEAILPLIEEAILVRAKAIWMQPGAFLEVAAKKASDAGLLVVAGRCIAVDYRRLV